MYILLATLYYICEHCKYLQSCTSAEENGFNFNTTIVSMSNNIFSMTSDSTISEIDISPPATSSPSTATINSEHFVDNRDSGIVEDNMEDDTVMLNSRGESVEVHILVYYGCEVLLYTTLVGMSI